MEFPPHRRFWNQPAPSRLCSGGVPNPPVHGRATSWGRDPGGTEKVSMVISAAKLCAQSCKSRNQESTKGRRKEFSEPHPRIIFPTHQVYKRDIFQISHISAILLHRFSLWASFGVGCMGVIATLCRRNVYGDGEFNPCGAKGAAKKHLGDDHGLEDTENRRDFSRHGN
jgi:hypothetical protein